MELVSNLQVVLLFICGSLGFISITLLIGRFLRPHNPTPEKMTTYESGEVPVSTNNSKFNVRYYIIALVFLLFEAEIIFLFPWSTVFSDSELLRQTNSLWGWFSLMEIFIFIFILGLGLVYVWKNEMLNWIKIPAEKFNPITKIPKKVYEEFNEKYERTDN